MKKPEKRDIQYGIPECYDGKDMAEMEAKNEGFNQACDEWEAYYEQEIKKLAKSKGSHDSKN